MIDTKRTRVWLSSLPGGRRFGHVRWQSLARYLVIGLVVASFLSAVFHYRHPAEDFILDKTSVYLDAFLNRNRNHTIDELIDNALDRHNQLLARQSRNLTHAAAEYRRRRNRHPPPGFDAWYQYAADHDAVVVEDFFDRIYADIAPYWGLGADTIAQRASSWHHVVRVRNGLAHPVGNTEGKVPWLQLWTDLVQEAAPFLPDVDMPINYMDESRLLVPWEDISKYLKAERRSRKVLPTSKVMDEFTGLASVDAAGDEGEDGSGEPYDPDWKSGSFWEFTRATCAPDSPSRNATVPESYEDPPEFPGEDWDPEHQYRGYVANFTAASDPCGQPHLRDMHATFIEPVSMSVSTELIPLFGGSKLPNNNEILIPGAMYLTDDPFYSGGDSHGPPWREKKTGVVWRGVASGGRNKRENWSHFQRHRLVEMLNGTTVAGVEREEKAGSSDARAPTFAMPPLSRYDYKRRREGKVGKWLAGVADAGFVELLCFPAGECGYVEPHLSTVGGISMADQYHNKFMPDVDGNSFSARFRGLLASTSVPIKSTVYAEWHDDRLVPWLHFAPMDNTFQDLYGILDYFTANRKGDRAARWIAEQGAAWAQKALRREDMLLYVWRVLLEFARVCDKNREWIGFVDDVRDVDE